MCNLETYMVQKAFADNFLGGYAKLWHETCYSLLSDSLKNEEMMMINAHWLNVKTLLINYEKNKNNRASPDIELAEIIFFPQKNLSS